MTGARYAVEYVKSTDRPSCGTHSSLYFFAGIGEENLKYFLKARA